MAVWSKTMQEIGGREDAVPGEVAISGDSSGMMVSVRRERWW